MPTAANRLTRNGFDWKGDDKARAGMHNVFMKDYEMYERGDSWQSIDSQMVRGVIAMGWTHPDQKEKARE